MVRENRVEKLREYMEKQNIDVSVVIDPLNQCYLTGFHTVIYSRPIITLVFHDSIEMIVPALEELHAKEEAEVDSIHIYYEHPEKAHLGTDPYKTLLSILKQKRVGRIAVEKAIISQALFEILAQVSREKPTDIGEFVQEMRMIKDKDEIELIKKAAQLADIGVMKSIESARPGMTELEIDGIGSAEILRVAAEKYPGSRVEMFVMSPSGPERTTLPHVFSIARRLQPGDVVIHSRQVGLNGYRAESERTFFISRPKKEYRDPFEIMLAAQEAAIKAIRPGVKCKEVDEAARSIIREAGYADYFIHRTGHGLGLSAHEPPYLRFDSDVVLKEGMVISVEPAFFIPKVGGFRHSDTVVVTKKGAEVITKAPRDFESLVV